MRRALLCVLVLLSMQGSITCLRIRDIRVPAHVAEGSEAVLGCKFELQGQQLYAVKWLMNEREFYHYKPGRDPVSQAFSDQGVSVDLERSSMSWVTLVLMTRESAGEYTCEVTAEGPSFRKVVAKKNITVDLLPEVEPQVTGVRKFCEVNQPIVLNCTCLGARPECQVKWLVNSAPAPQYYLNGPWYSRSAHRLGAIDTTLGLKFGVHASHFQYGVMTLKCQATLAPLYMKEVEFKYQNLPGTKLGKLIENTTQPVVTTTEIPCTSTIKIEIQPPNHSLWSVATSTEPDSAGFLDNSILLLLFCISLRALL